MPSKKSNKKGDVIFHVSFKVFVLVGILPIVIGIAIMAAALACKIFGDLRTQNVGTPLIVLACCAFALGSFGTCIFSLRLLRREKLVIGDESISILIRDATVKRHLPYSNIRSVAFAKKAGAIVVDVWDHDDEDTYPTISKATSGLNQWEFGHDFTFAVGGFDEASAEIYKIFLRKFEAWQRDNDLDRG